MHGLGYSKAAMALLGRKLATGGDRYSTYSGILVYGAQIRGLFNTRGTLFSDGPNIVPRF
jgi:hypothetical protein